MSDPKPREPRSEFSRKVARKEARKVRARTREDRGVWFGLGMMGVIGWSVSIPTLICVAIGVWMDRKWPAQVSYTLMLLTIGIVLGCINAWYWVERESHRGE